MRRRKFSEIQPTAARLPNDTLLSVQEISPISPKGCDIIRQNPKVWQEQGLRRIPDCLHVVEVGPQALVFPAQGAVRANPPSWAGVVCSVPTTPVTALMTFTGMPLVPRLPPDSRWRSWFPRSRPGRSPSRKIHPPARRSRPRPCPPGYPEPRRVPPSPHPCR